MATGMLAFIVGALLQTAVQEESAKAAVPDSGARTAAVREIRDLFKGDYARKDPEGRRALASQLLEQGVQSRSDGPSCFALLSEAGVLAGEAGAVDVAFDAIDRLNEFFDLSKGGVDGSAKRKLEVLTAASRSVRDLDGLRSLAQGYLTVSREGAAEGDFRDAESAARKAASMARKARDRQLADEASEFAKDLVELKREFAAASKVDLEGAIDIGDKKGNLNVGRYLCFVKEEWARGLEYLQWCGEKELAAVAKKDLAGPAESGAQAAVGHGWYGLAKKERTALHCRRYEGRARHWYEKAVAGVSGVGKLLVEKRLAELEPVVPGKIDLYVMIDPAKDAVSGSWRREGRLVLHERKPGDARVMVPYEPPSEYDVVAEVERRSDGEFSLGLVSGGRQFVVSLAPARRIVGIGRLDNQDFQANEATFRELDFPPNRRVIFRCQVRKDGLVVDVNGQRAIDWKGESTRLYLNPIFNVPNPKALFFRCHGTSEYVLHKLHVIEVTGTGKRLR